MAEVRRHLCALLYTLLLFFTVTGQSPNLTSTSDFVCFGEEVTLTCSAEDSVRWSSDDVIGEGMSIDFLLSVESPGDIVARGNVIAEYLRDEGTTVVSSLKFNATSDVSVITCTGRAARSKSITVLSSPNNDSDISVNNNNTVMWGKPSNHENFTLENYVVTLRNSSGDNIIEGSTTLPPDTQSIPYELQTGNYSFNLTVISSCGDVASRIYEFQVLGSMTESTESTESTSEPTSEPESGESGDDSSTIPTWGYVGVVIVVVIIIVVVVAVVVMMICFFKGKNKGETKAPFPNSVPMEGK